MIDELYIYRNARGTWRYYWLMQSPFLFLAFLIIKYGHHINNTDFIRSFGYIALVLSFILQFTGIFHLFGLRTKLLTINKSGIILQISPFDKYKLIEIKWEEILSAKVAARKFRRPINLLAYYGPALGSLEIEEDVLVLKLKAHLPSQAQDLIYGMTKAYFSWAQIVCSKDGEEIWVAERPAGGYSCLLENIQGYLSASSKNAVHKAINNKFRWYISLFLDLILASGILALNVLALSA